jgi:hypothetical protein
MPILNTVLPLLSIKNGTTFYLPWVGFGTVVNHSATSMIWEKLLHTTQIDCLITIA